MEDEQNVNLIWCIISSVTAYLFAYGYLLTFYFFLKSACQVNYSLAINFDKIVISFLCFIKAPLPPDIENNSAMIDLKKYVVIYFWYGKPRLIAFSGI